MRSDLVPCSEKVQSSRSRRSRLCSFFTRGSSSKSAVCRLDKRRVSRAVVGGQTMTRHYHYPESKLHNAAVL